MKEDADPMSNDRIPVGDRIVIYPRGQKLIWTADFHDGLRHGRKSLRTSNKKVALTRAMELGQNLATGEYRPVKIVLIEKTIEAYLAYLRTEGRARRTITRYGGELSAFAAFVAKKDVRRLDHISISLLDAYRAGRAEDHDLATVYHETVVIKQLLKWAKRRGLIASNPIVDYELHKPRSKEKPTPTLDEVLLILKQCTRRRQIEFATLAFTGMRSGELQGLKRENVNLKDGWIDIVDQVDGQTKTVASVRSVPIHPCLLRNLASHRPGSHILFFTSEPSRTYPQGGRPINTKKLNDYFKAAAIRAGLQKDYTVHSLRHFFKTFCIDSRVPREMVDRWQGHCDGSVGGRYYHVHDPESTRFMNSVPFKAEEPDGQLSNEGEGNDQDEVVDFGGGMRLIRPVTRRGQNRDNASSVRGDGPAKAG